MILYYVILWFSAVPNHPWFGSDIGGITFFKVTGALCAVYAVFRLTMRKSVPPFLSTWPARLFIVLFLMAVISHIFTNLGADVTNTAISIYLSVGFLFFITLTVIDSRERLQASLLSIMAGIGIASLYTVREWQKAGFSYYRPGYVAGEANLYAAATLLALPLSYYLAREKGSALRRIFCWGCLAITAIGFVSAASRGGLVGLALAVIYMLIRSERRLGLMISAGFLLLVMLFSPISPIRRALHPSYGDEASTQTHKILWATGLQLIRENPFFGIGLGNFKEKTAELHVLANSSAMAHNTYLEYAAELGIPALMIFLAVLVCTFLLLEKVRKRAADRFFRQAALGLQTGLVGFAGSAFFFSAEYEKPFWLVVFICCCMPPILLAEKAAEKKPVKLKELRPDSRLGFGTVQKVGGAWIGERWHEAIRRKPTRA
jgi:putative inorganic carbon (hco3(-)) transporter